MRQLLFCVLLSLIPTAALREIINNHGTGFGTTSYHSSGFAAGCEAGLRPAGRALTNSGAMPLVWAPPRAEPAPGAQPQSSIQTNGGAEPRLTSGGEAVPWISSIVQGQAQRRTVSSQKAVGQYTCPMHATVKAKSAGRCPKCGMKLVPVKAEKVANGCCTTRPCRFLTSKLLDQDGRKVHFYTRSREGKDRRDQLHLHDLHHDLPTDGRNLRARAERFRKPRRSIHLDQR